jgi:hypothetical protein
VARHARCKGGRRGGAGGGTAPVLSELRSVPLFCAGGGSGVNSAGMAGEPGHVKATPVRKAPLLLNSLALSSRVSCACTSGQLLLQRLQPHAHDWLNSRRRMGRKRSESRGIPSFARQSNPGYAGEVEQNEWWGLAAKCTWQPVLAKAESRHCAPRVWVSSVIRASAAWAGHTQKTCRSIHCANVLTAEHVTEQRSG